MRIMTWNINRFDGVWDWYSKEKDKNKEERERIARRIIRYIGQLISDKDDVVVLQEFPYKAKNNSCIEYNDWKNLFEENDLTVMEPDGEGLNVTVAVVPKKEGVWVKTVDDKKTSFGEDGKDYLNKYIELELKKELRVLGIHLSNSSFLLPLLHGMVEADRPDLIVGDFNSGDYVIADRWDDKKEEVRQQFRKLINNYGYTDISGGVVTDHITGSSIDHFLIKNTTLFRCEINSVSVDETRKDYSDHYPIIVEMNKKL